MVCRLLVFLLPAAAFPASDSMNWPMVILEGIACGLMMRSGTMPSSVKGRSSCGTIKPMTPFCPWRDGEFVAEFRDALVADADFDEFASFA